jgi:CcmD family protein
MSYVLAGYAATVVGLGGYAVWVVRRARALDRLRQGG